MRKFVVRLVALVMVFGWGSGASAAPIYLTMQLNGLSGPLFVNSVLTELPGGMTFQIVVDDTTTDIYGPSQFGLFPATSVTLTVPDLGIIDEIVTTPLGYFEDDSSGGQFERAGLSPLVPNASVYVGLDAPGQIQIGNPNLLDTIPGMTGNPSNSLWDNPFSVTTAGGTTLSGNGNVFFDSSFLGASAPIPEPNTALLLGVGLVGLGIKRRRRGASHSGDGRVS